jgi:hypothetical protein
MVQRHGHNSNSLDLLRPSVLPLCRVSQPQTTMHVLRRAVWARENFGWRGHSIRIGGLPEQPPGRRATTVSVVLDQAKLVVLRIGHHDDRPVFVVVSLAREMAAQGGDEVDTLVNVIDGDV